VPQALAGGVECDRGPALEPLDCREHRLRCCRGGSTAGLWHESEAVVELVCVGAGVVNTDVGEEPADHDGVDSEATQQQVEVGGEERAVPALADKRLTGQRIEPPYQLGTGGPLHAVDGLVAVELAPEVDTPRTVHLLGHDHGPAAGPMTLDLGLRMRVHALAERLAEEALGGVMDLTPGIRSLQLKLDPDVVSVDRALEVVRSLELDLPPTTDLAVPSRVVHLPLSWDDPATREATERYMAGVRSDAPWCPWNIEFIRRVNGLDDVQDVHDLVFEADYLVLGLGDVYLGAPVATPLDPRQRLVTTKYNPARTWTPENAVGIGGAYLCIYGMEGPGGYQFVGRTTQVWSRHRTGGLFEPGSPWLLRFFDRIRWFPVEAEELMEMRGELAAGRLDIETEQGSFTLADHKAFLEREAEGIAAFRERQSEAFGAERRAWAEAGEFEPRPDHGASAEDTGNGHVKVPDGAVLVEAPVSASVWTIEVEPGATVNSGERLLTLETMKQETGLESPVDGEVLEILVDVGDQVLSGSALVVVAGKGDA